MKKLFIIAVLTLFACPSFADTIKLADAIDTDITTAENLCKSNHRCSDKYLFTYDIKTSLDDAVTLTILSRNGTTLQAITTTGATSGEAGKFTTSWLLSGGEQFTLTGIGSGTATVDVTIGE